ncbi:hypothetical protein OAL43_01505 [bacterium]|nr:hypothetical protein [bacterium]MDC0278861.1 hypothetical protein [bacterium]
MNHSSFFFWFPEALMTWLMVTVSGLVVMLFDVGYGEAFFDGKGILPIPYFVT